MDKLNALAGTLLPGFKRVGAASLDFLCRVLAVFGFGMVVLQVNLVVLLPLLESLWLSLLIPFAAYLFGFTVMAVILFAAGKKKVVDYSYEGTGRLIDYRLLFPAAIAFLILSVILRGAFNSYFIRLVYEGKLLNYDAYSLQPHLCAASVFGSATAGAVIAFYPSNRIMSHKSLLTTLAISGLLWFVTGASANYGAALGVCFGLYVVCAVIICNQSYIIRAYSGVTVTKITPTARWYNLRMILLALVLTAFAGIFMYILVNGLFVIGKFIFYLIVYTVVMANKPNQPRTEDTYSAVGDMAMGVNRLEKANSLFTVVGALVFIVGAILIFIFIRHSLVQEILEWFKDLLRSFVSLFMGTGDYASDHAEREINYKDTVVTLKTNKKTSAAQTSLARPRMSARDFRSELSRLKTDEEKLTYSYSMMIGLLSRMNLSLRESDTPHEKSEKIAAGMTLGSIGEITELIEQIKYAEKTADPAASERVLASVCEVVEKQLD